MTQCKSCGGFCKKAGCERKNTQPDDLADLLASIKSKQQRIDELESQMQGLSNEINDFQNVIDRQKRELYDAKAQEPVAWMYDWYTAAGEADNGDEVINWLSTDYDEAHSPTMGCHNIRPLYARPVPFPTKQG